MYFNVYELKEDEMQDKIFILISENNPVSCDPGMSIPMTIDPEKDCMSFKLRWIIIYSMTRIFLLLKT